MSCSFKEQWVVIASKGIIYEYASREMNSVTPVRRKRCLLFRARDYYSLMRPCFVISFILGVFPFKITSSGLVCWKIGYLFSTIEIIVYTIHFLIILYQIDLSPILEYDSVPGTLQANFYFALGYSVNLVAYFYSYRRMLFLKQLHLVASRLPVETFQKLSRYLHAKDIFGFLFLVGQVPNVRSEYLPQMCFKICGLYTTLIVFIMDMLYMNCACVIKECFARINDNLRNLQHVLVTSEPHLLRRVYHGNKNPLLLMELKTIKKRHQQISDVLYELNETFGCQIIITSIMTFAEVTFSLYFFILRNFGNKEVNLEKQIWYSYFITSVAYYFIKMGLMALACENAKTEAALIGATIHEVAINTADKDIKDELQLFSLQVLYRDNTFTSKGLTMDATLLKTIIASTAMYLLILIQFMVSMNNPCTSGNSTANDTSLEEEL